MDKVCYQCSRIMTEIEAGYWQCSHCGWDSVEGTPLKNADDGIELTETERRAVRLIEQHADTDGAHHKQWLIDQLARAILGEKYDEWVMNYNEISGLNDYSLWDEGIAP